MTRITNFGRKRTCLEAGLSLDETVPEEAMDPGPISITRTEPASIDDGPGLPPKKKRKRTKMSKRDRNPGNYNIETVENNGMGEGEEGKRMTSGAGNAEGKPTSTEDTVMKPEKKKRQRDERQKALSASEHRRRKRITEKAAATTCFACREKGHAAKDCPVTKSHRDGENDNKQKTIVGMCYRCGSTRHTLSRCKKPTNPEDPLPFASCFVCSGKGHLASSCPQNKAKGIYPNGGCCKLCGDTSHLAKDCGLRIRSTAELEGSAALGAGREVGADEDDFHVLKRNTTELDRGDRVEERMRRLLRTGAGVISNVKPGTVPKPSMKKVVYF